MCRCSWFTSYLLQESQDGTVPHTVDDDAQRRVARVSQNAMHELSYEGKTRFDSGFGVRSQNMALPDGV